MPVPSCSFCGHAIHAAEYRHTGTVPCDNCGRFTDLDSLRNASESNYEVPDRWSDEPVQRRQPTRDYDDYDRPVRRLPVRKSSLTWLWILLGGLFIGGVLVVGGICLAIFLASKPTWTAWTSPDGQCSVSFPSANVQTKTQSQNILGITHVQHLYYVERRLGREAYMISYLDAPGIDDQLNAVYDSVIAELKLTGFTMSTRTNITVNGISGIELRGTMSDPANGISNAPTTMRLICTNQRFYILIALGTSTISPDYVNQFMNSFKVIQTGGPANRKK